MAGEGAALSPIMHYATPWQRGQSGGARTLHSGDGDGTNTGWLPMPNVAVDPVNGSSASFDVQHQYGQPNAVYPNAYVEVSDGLQAATAYFQVTTDDFGDSDCRVAAMPAPASAPAALAVAVPVASGPVAAQASTSVLVGRDLPSAAPVAATPLAASALPPTSLASAAPAAAVDSALTDPDLLSSPATVGSPASVQAAAPPASALAPTSDTTEQLAGALPPSASIGSAGWSQALDSFFSLDDDTIGAALAG